MSDPPLLRVAGLVKSYAGRRVVDGLSLQLQRGEVLGLLGPNGAGKTTTLRMLYGFIKPDAGTILYQGRDFAQEREALRGLVGVCTQDDTLDEEFSVRDNLRIYASYFRPRQADLPARIDELLAQFNLTEFADHRPPDLSGGYKRRLMIARSIIHRPAVLFLDEPTTGLDPAARLDLWRLVVRLRSEGLGIVLTTHYMDEAERLSDRIAVLSKGRSVAEGSTREVLGAVLGEHIVEVARDQADAAAVQAWSREVLGKPPGEALDAWHIALTAQQLVDFTNHFAALRFAVRDPTLDDLFLALSIDQSHVSGQS